MSFSFFTPRSEHRQSDAVNNQRNTALWTQLCRTTGRVNCVLAGSGRYWWLLWVRLWFYATMCVWRNNGKNLRRQEKRTKCPLLSCVDEKHLKIHGKTDMWRSSGRCLILNSFKLLNKGSFLEFEMFPFHLNIYNKENRKNILHPEHLAGICWWYPHSLRHLIAIQHFSIEYF